MYHMCFTDDEPELPMKNTGLDKKGGSKVNETNKKMSRHKKRNKEKKPKLSSTQSKDSNNIPVENGSDDTRWPHFSDEDYIVFCFREDGAFDVVKDGKPETSNRFDCTSRSSRPVSRKVSNTTMS